MDNENLNETSIEESENENMETQEYNTSYEWDSQSIQQIVEDVGNIREGTYLLFWAFVVYFACHTIHMVFNKIRGIE